jgi:hypothetical protein
MRLTILIACLALAAASPSLRAGNAAPVWPKMSGVNVAVSVNGLNKLIKEVLPTFLSTLEAINIPDIEHKEVHVKPIGHIFVDVTDITVGNVQIPAVTLDTQAPHTVGFSTTNVNIPVHANWHWVGMGWPHIADSGSLDVTAQDGTAACQLSITALQGKPSATMLSDTCAFSNYNIKVHGGGDWLFNVLESLFNNFIKKTLNSALSKALTDALGTQLNEFFKTIPTQFELKTPDIEELDLMLNASLTATTMTNDALTLTDLMHFYGPNTWDPPCFSELPNPYLPNYWISGLSDREAQVYIAGEVINCALFVAWHEKAFKLDVTEGQLPSGTPDFLKTSWWWLLAPGLKSQYPDKHMTMLLSSTPDDEWAVRPDFTINSKGLHCSAEGVANFTIYDESHAQVIAMQVKLDAGLDVIIHKNASSGASTIVLQIQELAVNFTGKYTSQVGNVDVSGLEILSNAILPVARGLINAIISQGLPIPILTGFGLENPKIVFSDSTADRDFFAIGADIVYTAPPTLR